MDWTDIETKLRERVGEVCQHLLPQGKREGNEWLCGVTMWRVNLGEV